MAFSGNTDSFYDPANSYVDEVRSVGPCRCLIRLHPPVFMARDPAFHRRPSSPQLSRSDAQVIASRKGIPISLSVIYSAVAARGSLRLHGALDRSSLCPQCTPACAGVYSHSSWCAEAANFPNQFLVRFIRWVLNSYRHAIAQSFVAFSVAQLKVAIPSDSCDSDAPASPATLDGYWSGVYRDHEEQASTALLRCQCAFLPIPLLPFVRRRLVWRRRSSRSYPMYKRRRFALQSSQAIATCPQGS